MQGIEEPMPLTLRLIKQEDNAAVAHVIRTVMPEFNCVGDGFSINDPEVENMYAAYDLPNGAFFVLEEEGERAGAKSIVGVGGYAPLTGGPPGVCELRKMYVLRGGRGRGGGRLLMEACIAGARSAGFTQMYLETVNAMTDAAAVYKKYGFRYIEGPLGGTGHTGCDRFMLRAL